MFKGRFDHTIDDKGRLSIPSRFREILSAHYEEILVITNDFESCLVAYPLSVWQEFEKRIADRPQFHPEIRNLKRFYISGAQECPIDKQGRIMIPEDLRMYAGIKKDVILVGQVRIIEIWAKETWKDVFDKSKKSCDYKALADLGL